MHYACRLKSRYVIIDYITCRTVLPILVFSRVGYENFISQKPVFDAYLY